MATPTLVRIATNGIGDMEFGRYNGQTRYATYKFTLDVPVNMVTINLGASYIGYSASYGWTIDQNSSNTSTFTAYKTFTMGASSSAKYWDVGKTISFERPLNQGTHYLHICWYSGSESYGYIKSSSITYTPVTYTVSYNGNNQNANNTPPSQSKAHGTELTLVTETPTLTGYTFKNWNTKPDGTGDSYESGASYTNNEDVTLYAQWQVNTLTIQMHVNDGEKASDASNSMTISNNIALYEGKSQVINYGNTFDLWNYNSPSWIKVTRPGYIVSPGKEFCTTSDGTGEIYNQATIYKISDFADITKESKTVILYVNWKTGGIIHYSDGTQWIPCQVYYSDGTKWVHVMPYYSDGNDWVQCT